MISTLMEAGTKTYFHHRVTIIETPLQLPGASIVATGALPFLETASKKSEGLRRASTACVGSKAKTPPVAHVISTTDRHTSHHYVLFLVVLSRLMLVNPIRFAKSVGSHCKNGRRTIGSIRFLRLTREEAGRGGAYRAITNTFGPKSKPIIAIDDC
ncbi:hypothetical protein BU26DRAFT_511274 [Trematosphaeria pertusa]|uniref:Uncharacterized protein n=1 Tax=Trematosphaeria pertusa TaxID=390896 RepID=A0A6A6HVH6_9PLEO|nr:uncharacterized protein BU26DRAFT_511274 [Trematosphaeria pertusa]KAF2241899.1 hypothetical protein BU26DRAFT_511274 [Trematosphaeria pertusa]